MLQKDSPTGLAPLEALHHGCHPRECHLSLTPHSGAWGKVLSPAPLGAFLPTNTQATRVSTNWGSSMSVIPSPNLVSSRIWGNENQEPHAKRQAPDGKAQQAKLRPLRTVLFFVFKKIFFLNKNSFNAQGNLRWSNQHLPFCLSKKKDPWGATSTFPSTVMSSHV